ncbi:hypothetical protein ABK040_016019 [Willaertia magna]
MSLKASIATLLVVVCCCYYWTFTEIVFAVSLPSLPTKIVFDSNNAQLNTHNDYLNYLTTYDQCNSLLLKVSTSETKYAKIASLVSTAQTQVREVIKAKADLELYYEASNLTLVKNMENIEVQQFNQHTKAKLDSVSKIEKQLTIKLQSIQLLFDSVSTEVNTSLPLAYNSCLNDLTSKTVLVKDINGLFAKSCKEYKNMGFSVDGRYTIKDTATSTTYDVFCDMTTSGGGWTLIMQTSETSAYVYDHAVWTATTGGSSSMPVDGQDYVSLAFYNLIGTESMLAMGNRSTSWNSWSHSANTARNLVNSPKVATTQTGTTNCEAKTNCGSGTSHIIQKKPLGILSGAPVTTTANNWARFGYVNDNNSWGPNVRIGISLDNDTSDSGDTVIGFGIKCANNCPSYCITGSAHGYGSGYYYHKDWSTAPLDGPLKGWLFIR